MESDLPDIHPIIKTTSNVVFLKKGKIKEIKNNRILIINKSVLILYIVMSYFPRQIVGNVVFNKYIDYKEDKGIIDITGKNDIQSNNSENYSYFHNNTTYNNSNNLIINNTVESEYISEYTEYNNQDKRKLDSGCTSINDCYNCSLHVTLSEKCIWRNSQCQAYTGD